MAYIPIYTLGQRMHDQRRQRNGIVSFAQTRHIYSLNVERSNPFISEICVPRNLFVNGMRLSSVCSSTAARTRVIFKKCLRTSLFWQTLGHFNLEKQSKSWHLALGMPVPPLLPSPPHPPKNNTRGHGRVSLDATRFLDWTMA